MAKNDDGGPAFPQSETARGNPMSHEYSGVEGMTLLDHFAGLAMIAEFITSGQPGEAADAFVEGAESAGHTAAQHLAFNAYEVAAALVAEKRRREAGPQ